MFYAAWQGESQAATDLQLRRAWASASHFVSHNPHFDKKQLIKAAIS